jgi:hypothetical protein
MQYNVSLFVKLINRDKKSCFLVYKLFCPNFLKILILMTFI